MACSPAQRVPRIACWVSASVNRCRSVLLRRSRMPAARGLRVSGVSPGPEGPEPVDDLLELVQGERLVDEGLGGGLELLA